MLMTSKCNKMENTNKTVIQIAELKVVQYLFLIRIRYSLKVSMICNKFLK